MKIFLMAASLRTGSVNKKLTDICYKHLSSQHEIDYADMADFNAPLYNGDEESSVGIPDTIKNFVDRITKADKIIIASPEYNYSIPGVLKNIIDWASRAQPMPWKEADILLLSASPSPVGGNRGLWHARVPLEGCGAFVYPEMFSLSDAYNAFDEQGNLKDANTKSRLEKLLYNFLVH